MIDGDPSARRRRHRACSTHDDLASTFQWNVPIFNELIKILSHTRTSLHFKMHQQNYDGNKHFSRERYPDDDVDDVAKSE